MDRMSEMEAFVEVVTAGSFSAAARAMGLTPSAVSKLVSRIEERLRTRLVDRSTRHLKLTAEGETYYGHCVRIVADIAEAEHAITASTAQPHGLLRVNSSVPIGTYWIEPLAQEFLARHPRMSIDLSLSDEVVDLLEERADVAVRIGPLQDSSLKARKLCDSRRVIIAAPEYLRRHGTPRTPADLAGHNCLAFNLKPSLNAWPFVVEGKTVNIPVRGNFTGNNGISLQNMALRGLGLARLAWFQVGEAVREGRLVPVLEEFHPGDLQGVYALFLAHRFVSPRVRAFIDFLVERMGEGRPWLGAEAPPAAGCASGGGLARGRDGERAEQVL
jgi:DNA-binding transcriptional LysR family regulator